jgi:hypothetical protein
VVYFLFCDVCVKKEEEEIRRRVSCISRKMGKRVFFSVMRDKIICNNGVSVPKSTICAVITKLYTKLSLVFLQGSSLREDKLKNLKSDLQKQQNIFTVATKSNEVAVHASFAISQIIAKKSKLFTDGEYVKECAMKAAEILCPEK